MTVQRCALQLAGGIPNLTDAGIPGHGQALDLVASAVVCIAKSPCR
jgi:hypothetical protein